jgi:2-haloalkanoic acid dehalogenase type II
MAHAVFAFDAYGTLFDVHAPVRRHAEAVGPEADRLSALWRAKQLEYTWVRSLMGRFADFWTITEQALDYAFAAIPSADASMKPALLRAYWELEPYPEVPLVLETLKREDRRLAILSNGSQVMLDSAVEAAGLAGLFDASILKGYRRPLLATSTDGVGTKVEVARRLGADADPEDQRHQRGYAAAREDPVVDLQHEHRARQHQHVDQSAEDGNSQKCAPEMRQACRQFGLRT